MSFLSSKDIKQWFIHVWQRQICRELNQVEGVVSKVVPEENDLTSDQLSEAISLIHSAKSAKNNEKILEFVCSSGNLLCYKYRLANVFII